MCDDFAAWQRLSGGVELVLVDGVALLPLQRRDSQLFGGRGSVDSRRNESDITDDWAAVEHLYY